MHPHRLCQSAARKRDRMMGFPLTICVGNPSSLWRHLRTGAPSEGLLVQSFTMHSRQHWMHSHSLGEHRRVPTQTLKPSWRPFRAPASCTPWAPQLAARSTSSCKRTFSAVQKTAYCVLCPCTGVKLLVFAHHTAVLDAIQGACLTGRPGRRGVRIDGSTPAAARKQGVDEFQNSEGCRVALLSITAAGVRLGYCIFVITQ